MRVDEMNYKKGLVISVYDKYEDLVACIELAILAGFHKIVVVAEDEPIPRDMISKVNGYIDLVEVIFVKSTTFIPAECKNKFDFFFRISSRVWESQRTGLLLLSEKCDFVMHTHADGWVLDGKSIDTIVNKMIELKCSFAHRGMGLTFRNFPGSPTGTIDDHFYIIKSSAIKESKFIRRDLIDYLPGYFNIHGILSQWIISEIGISNTYFYDDTTGWLNWDLTYRNYKRGNPLRSFVFNKDLKLLHCHSDDFPGNYGKALQAKYIKENTDYKKSRFLTMYVDEYYDDEVINELKHIYNRKKIKLNIFLDFDEDYKNLDLMEKRYKEFKRHFIKSILKNFTRLIYRKFKKIIKNDSSEIVYVNDMLRVRGEAFKKDSDNIAHEKVNKNKC